MKNVFCFIFEFDKVNIKKEDQQIYSWDWKKLWKDNYF